MSKNPKCALFMDYKYEMSKILGEDYDEEHAREQYHVLMCNRTMEFVKIELKKELVGFIVMATDEDIQDKLNIDAFIEEYYIKPRFRGKGLLQKAFVERYHNIYWYESYGAYVAHKNIPSFVMWSRLFDDIGYKRECVPDVSAGNFYVWRKKDNDTQ